MIVMITKTNKHLGTLAMICTQHLRHGSICLI